MQNRWAVLALLFTVRLAMGFQFQAVGAVSPAYMRNSVSRSPISA